MCAKLCEQKIKTELLQLDFEYPINARAHFFEDNGEYICTTTRKEEYRVADLLNSFEFDIDIYLDLVCGYLSANTHEFDPEMNPIYQCLWNIRSTRYSKNIGVHTLLNLLCDFERLCTYTQVNNINLNKTTISC